MPIISGGGGGGGGPTAGSYLPAADAVGVTLDTTTYTNPVEGADKLATLVFPLSTAMLAVAITGDAFPRYMFVSNPADGMYIGDGTTDPYNGAQLCAIGVGSSGANRYLVLEGGQGTLQVGLSGTIATVGAVFRADSGISTRLVIDSGALPTVAPVSGTAFQCLTTRDVFLCVPFTGDATNNAATLKMELSPDNVTFSTLDTLSIAAALNLTGAINVPVSLHVPAAWFVKLTATHGTIGTSTYY